MNAGNSSHLDATASEFYRKAMHLLIEHRVPFMVGGGHALVHYTGIVRDTKDFDVFLYQQDTPRALQLLARAGYKTVMTDARWIGKAFCRDFYVDFIFGSANCIAVVDDQWFAHALTAEILGVKTLLIPIEEMIWSKAFVMDRDRFDGADIVHLILRNPNIDWQRLLSRFGENWSILLIYLLYFQFIYPSEMDRVPKNILQELLKRAEGRLSAPAAAEHICNGPLFSIDQYAADLNNWAFLNGKEPFVRKLRQNTQSDVA